LVPLLALASVARVEDLNASSTEEGYVRIIKGYLCHIPDKESEKNL
jgi:hypothetical protein